MDLFKNIDLQHIGREMLSRKETVAVAESVTSGMIQFAFSNIPNAAKFYQGGITTYNLGQKFKHLLVEPIHAQGCNCVSQQVADEMATHVCKLFHSSWGIGITGYATPSEESGMKVYAFVSVVHNDKVVVAQKVDGDDPDPIKVQIRFAEEALKFLTKGISEEVK